MDGCAVELDCARRAHARREELDAPGEDGPPAPARARMVQFMTRRRPPAAPPFPPPPRDVYNALLGR
jgi:hypothetical protein